MTRAVPPELVLEALVSLVADQVAARLVAVGGAGARDEYFDEDTAPCGKRTFLKAARAGEFPAFKRGPKVLARRADVIKWIEAAPLERGGTQESGGEGAAPPPAPGSNAAIFAQRGYRLGSPPCPPKPRRGG